MLHKMAPARHAARSHHIYCAMLVSKVLGDKDNCAAINIEFTKSSMYSTQIYYDCDWYNDPVDWCSTQIGVSLQARIVGLNVK